MLTLVRKNKTSKKIEVLHNGTWYQVAKKTPFWNSNSKMENVFGHYFDRLEIFNGAERTIVGFFASRSQIGQLQDELSVGEYREVANYKSATTINSYRLKKEYGIEE